jgi:hypothetical protein
MSPPNVTPSVPLGGTFSSNEREKSSTVSEVAAAVLPEGKKQPTEMEIEEVRRDWGKRPIDRAAILKILLALYMRKSSYAEFRIEAARRVQEVQPANRVGFVIRLAESGEFYREQRSQFDDTEMKRFILPRKRHPSRKEIEDAIEGALRISRSERESCQKS